MVKRLFSSNFWWLFLFLLAGGCASLILRYELLWDFANYHYYNPWAFFNDRWMYDIAPAGINTFFNPLLDIPLYLLIKYFNDYPNLIIFIQGLWSGAAAFMAFQLAKIFFDFGTWKGRIQTFLAVAIGVTSWPFFMQIGTSTNEMPIAIMVMFSWWLLFKELKDEKSISTKAFFVSGLVLGMAAGLKLTAATYCVSTGISLILCYKMFKPFPKLIGLFILGGIIGFLITNGFWMWRLWQTFENPVFPLLNNIFQSDWYDKVNYRDTMYLPDNILGYIFYPFYLLAGKIKSEGDTLYIDLRFICLFIVVIVSIFYLLHNALKYHKFPKISSQLIVLFTLCINSYITWLIVFSIQRYAVPVLISTSIIIIMGLSFLYPKQGNVKFILWSSTSIIIIYSFLMTPYYSVNWGKKNDTMDPAIYLFTDIWPELKDDETYIDKYGKFTNFVEMEEIKLPDNTLLQLYDFPLASIIPLLAKKSDIRAVRMSGTNMASQGSVLNEGKWLDLKKEIIEKHKGPKSVLIRLSSKLINISNIFYQYAKHQGLECHLLINNMFEWMLCVPPEQVKEIFKWRYQDQSSK